MTRCFLSRTTVYHTAEIYKGLVGSCVASVSATRQELVNVKRAFRRMQQRIQFLFNFLALEGYMEGSGMQATLGPSSPLIRGLSILRSLHADLK